MNWNNLIKAGVAVAVASACFGAQAASNGVTVSLSAEKSKLGAADDVVVKVTMTNTSGSAQYVLKYYTPFAGIEEALFEVTRDGVAVPYLGAHIKRQAPTASDYLLLKPGASYSAKVELTALYDMSVTGDYAVRFRAQSMNLFSASQGSQGLVSTATQLGEIASDSVSLWVDGRYPRGTEAPTLQKAMQTQVAGLATTGCTASQTSTITSAISAAQTMANNGSNYLNAGTTGTRYTKWFGAYNSTRYATVKTHFTNIKNAFASQPVTVDCGCTQSYYAYVYPTQPYKIYVCNAFWTAPLTGTDSKGGTLVHEMSHFNVVAGTDDWAYGQSAAASLAISNPTNAIDNADTHEYFGENTPSLP